MSEQQNRPQTPERELLEPEVPSPQALWVGVDLHEEQSRVRASSSATPRVNISNGTPPAAAPLQALRSTSDPNASASATVSQRSSTAASATTTPPRRPSMEVSVAGEPEQAAYLERRRRRQRFWFASRKRRRISQKAPRVRRYRISLRRVGAVKRKKRPPSPLALARRRLRRRPPAPSPTAPSTPPPPLGLPPLRARHRRASRRLSRVDARRRHPTHSVDWQCCDYLTGLFLT